MRAVRSGLRITTILETHRNEDYVIGSVELADRTGAQIWHADGQLDYRYGQAVTDGQSWKAGRLKITAIHSPGHTPGSMSYLLDDPGGRPWVIFTGDALFAGILVGGDAIQISLGLPAATVQVFNGTLLVFLIMGEFFLKNRVRLQWGLKGN